VLFCTCFLHLSLPAFAVNNAYADRYDDSAPYHRSLFDNSPPSIDALLSNLHTNHILPDGVVLKEENPFQLAAQLNSTGDGIMVDKYSRHFLEFYSTLNESDIFIDEIEDVFSYSNQYLPQSSFDNFQPLYRLNLSGSSYLKTGLILPSPAKPAVRGNYRRLLAGSRVEAGLDENVVCGLNITKDLTEVMDMPANGFDLSMLSEYGNWDYCFDLNIKDFPFLGFKNLGLKTEIANLRLNGNTENSANQPKRHLSYKVSLAGKIGELLFDCGYEKMEPEFYAGNDSAPVNQELFRTNLNYKFLDWLRLKAGYATHREDLNDALTMSKQSQSPQISLFVNPLPWDKNLSLDFSYKCNLYGSADDSLNSTEDIYKTTLSYSLKTVYISLTGEHSTNVDKTEPVNDYNAGRTSLALGLKKLEVSPSLKLSTSVNSSIKRKKYGSSTQQDEFQKIMADFALEYKDFLSIKSGYFMEENNKFEEFSDSTSHGWGFEITFKPINDKLDTEFSLRYEQKKNDCEDTSKSYTDKVFKAKMAFKL